MVKIFENNINLIVTTIFYILFRCETIADANSTTNTADRSIFLYEHTGISHATVKDATTERRVRSARRSNDTNIFRDERAREIAASENLNYGDVRKRYNKGYDEFTIDWGIAIGPEKYKGLDETVSKITKHPAKKHKKDATTIKYSLGFGNETEQTESKHHFKRQRKHKENIYGDLTDNRTLVTGNADKEIKRKPKNIQPLPNTSYTGLKDPEIFESKNKHKVPKHNLYPKQEHNVKADGDRVNREPIKDKSNEDDVTPKRFQLRSEFSQTGVTTPRYASSPGIIKAHNIPKQYFNRERGQSDDINYPIIEKWPNKREETQNTDKIKKKPKLPVRQSQHESKMKLNPQRFAPNVGTGDLDGIPIHQENQGRTFDKKIHEDHQGNRESQNSREKFKDSMKTFKKTKPGHKKNHKHVWHENLEKAYSSSTHHAHHEHKHAKKIHDIRTGRGWSDPGRDGNVDSYSKPTKKVKLRMREQYNILRSTRMPAAYELQEETQYDHKQNDMTNDVPNVPLNEDLSPYAIEGQMKRFAKKFNKKFLTNMTVVGVGRTVEYNNIVLLKVTASDDDPESYLRAIDNKYTDEKPEKKIIFIVHGLTVAGMRHLIYNEELLETLIHFYTAHLDKFDLFIIPMANPDGYAATFNSQAYGYWNKNMSPQTGCPGVVLDRNFDVAWNNTQKMSSCSHGYPGATPFSEAETRAIRDLFHQYSHKIIAYIHVHASTYDAKIFKGDAVLYPRGYTETQTDDDRYIDLKGEIEEVMKNASFRVLSVNVDTLYNWYGKVTGTGVDYASSVYGIPYAMEFAMQLYEHIQKDALTQIWGRIINVVFKSIWKNINANPNDVKKK